MVEETSEFASSDLAGLLDQRFTKLESMVLEAQHFATEAATLFHPRRSRGNDQLLQHLARSEWRRRVRSNDPLPSLDEVEFRYFSQNGEDGIIWYLLSLIGDGSKRVVEICAGDGIECCSANLIVNHGWQALLFEGSPERVERGKRFYKHCGDTWYYPPRFVNEWISPDNVNTLLSANGLTGTSMWRSSTWTATIIGCGTRSSSAPNSWSSRSTKLWEQKCRWLFLTMANFVLPHGSVHRSASLRAFTRLANRRGYRLIGTERYGFNAFFLRNDCVPELIPEVSVDSCLKHPILSESYVRDSREATLASEEWVEV